MSGGRKHQLNNLDDPDFDPLDPSCVSDPACWLTPEQGLKVQGAFAARANMIKYARGSLPIVVTTGFCIWIPMKMVRSRIAMKIRIAVKNHLQFITTWI